MADKVTVIVEAVLKNEKFKKALKGSETASNKATKGISKGFSKVKLGFVVLAGVLTGIVARGFKSLIKSASDAQETLSKFDEVFKGLKKEADAVAKNLAKNFGVSSIAAKDLLASTGDLLQGFGFTTSASLQLSDKMIQLATDVASFKNIQGGTVAVLNSFNRALVGERESLKTLGIAILEVDIKNRALEKGLTLVNGQVDRQNKALITAELILERSKNSVGDFARTQTNFANQTRILKARFDDFVLLLSSKLLPIVTPILAIFIKLLKTEDTLASVTDELVKNNKEYAAITKTLADESKNLTDQERQKLEVRKSELRLQIVQSVERLNEAFKRQTDLVRDNKDTLKASRDEQNRLAPIIGNLEIQLNAARKATELSSSTERVRIDRLEQLRILTGRLSDTQAIFTKEVEKEFKAINDLKQAEIDVADGKKGIAIAINQELVSKAQLLGLNKELLTEVLELAKTVEIETDSLGKLEAAIEEVILTQKDLTEFLKVEGKEVSELTAELRDQEAALILKFADQKVEIEKATSARIRAIRAAAASETLQQIADVGNKIALITGKFFDNAISRLNMQADREKAILQKKFDDGLISQEEFENKSEKIDKDAKIAAAKKQRSAAIVDKIASLFGIAANTGMAVTKDIAASPLTFGQPWSGFAIGTGIGQAIAVGSKPLPDIPAFQSGVSNFGGGSALVGEGGPELVNLPPGSDVIPANLTDSLLGRGNASTVQNTTNTTNNNEGNTNIFNGIRDISEARNELLRSEGESAF